MCSLILDVKVAGVKLTTLKVMAIALVILGALLSVFDRIDNSGVSTGVFAGNETNARKRKHFFYSYTILQFRNFFIFLDVN